MRLGGWTGLLIGSLLMPWDAALSQQCQTSGTNQTCTNSILLSGGSIGLLDNATPTVTNASAGTISGTGGFAVGVRAFQDATVTNFGAISAVTGVSNQGIGILANNNGNVTNSGFISAIAGDNGVSFGVDAGNNANLTNSGTLSVSAGAGGQGIGIVAIGDANVTNSGTLSANSGNGGSSFGINVGHDANVMNSGIISGTTGDGSNGMGIRAQNNANVINSGTISGTAGASGHGFGLQVGLGAATVTNSGTISGTAGAGGQGFAIQVNVGATTVTNSGTISGFGPQQAGAILAGSSVTVINSGTISSTSVQQSITIFAGTDANVVNSGTISSTAGNGGFSFAIAAPHDANVTNSGTITATAGAGGRGVGIFANNNATVVNSGTIIGSASGSGQGYGIQVASGTADVTNAGTILGTTAALLFSGNADTLTLLTGSRIIGAINLGGGGDTINFRGGNHNLTFDTLAGATVTSTTPFAVSGNRAAAIDPTSFAMQGRMLGDFTRAVFDAVPAAFGSGAPGGGALAFAAAEAPSRIEQAFATIPGLSAYSGEGLTFKNPTVIYGDGSAIWARGFAGQRIQQQDGVLLRTANLFYGGLIGGDWQARPDLRLGAFLGGGKISTAIDLNQGSSNSDLVFGGAYARYDVAESFLHVAVQAGGSRNNGSRSINNNLLPNGLETASAAFDGWYVSEEARLGHRWALGSLAGAAYTLTPTLRLRYLYGSYDGYTETGTTSPLTVNGQTVSTLEERGEAKLTRSVALTPNDMLSTSVTGGVLATQRVGSNTVNAAMLGQAIPFATPGQANVWGGFGGLGLEWRTRNVTLFSAAEYLNLSDHSNVVSGRAGLRIAF